MSSHGLPDRLGIAATGPSTPSDGSLSGELHSLEAICVRSRCPKTPFGPLPSSDPGWDSCPSVGRTLSVLRSDCAVQTMQTRTGETFEWAPGGDGDRTVADQGVTRAAVAAGGPVRRPFSALPTGSASARARSPRGRPRFRTARALSARDRGRRPSPDTESTRPWPGPRDAPGRALARPRGGRRTNLPCRDRPHAVANPRGPHSVREGAWYPPRRSPLQQCAPVPALR